MTHPDIGDLIVGSSQVIRNLRDEVRRAAPRRTPVLIQGPTGAGKELVAQGLHSESGRRGPFVPFNVAAIPESLFESELLGHVRGAFSGAVRDHAGLLRNARHGTAFMDEIGELAVAAQAKLLRVLDTREIWSVGADVAQQIDFRLVTATNVDLAAAVRNGRFRSDLWFRLRGIVITVPALRDHPDDIASLAAHFARRIVAESGGGELVFTQSAMRALETYHWPGNVRELRQAIGHAAFLADGPVIDGTHITRVLMSIDDPVMASATGLESNSNERRNFLELLAVHGGDVKAVARVMGVDRSTVYRRMQRLGVTSALRPLRDWPATVGVSGDAPG